MTRGSTHDGTATGHQWTVVVVVVVVVVVTVVAG